MPTINIEAITNEFIKEGFFSEYLPSSFNLENTFDPCSIELSSAPDLVEPIQFNMSRFTDNSKRRTIYVPEFGSYISTVKYMKEKGIVEDLISLANDTHSFSPLIHPDGTLTKHERDYQAGITLTDADQDAFKSTYIPNIAEKIIRAQGAKGVLSLDISNFYTSIYTHLIPSIKLGYEAAEYQYKLQKANNADPAITEDYRTYVKLDEYVRNMNVARTNGLLPGIYISKFLAEALLSRIDSELETKNISFVRYVDDYEIFVYDESDIPRIQSHVSSCFQKYFLSLNNEKTKYSKFPFYVMDNLEKIYSKYIGSSPSTMDLMKLFNTFFQLETEGTKGAIRFLIKTIDNSFTVPDEKLLLAYLLNILVNDPRSLVKVCELIIQRKDQMTFSDDTIQLIDDLINRHVEANEHLETIWLLYMRRKITRKRLSAKVIAKIVESNNELAKLILIEEYKSSLSQSSKQKIINNASSWLLCYQLFYNNLIDKESFSEKSHIKKNLAFYSQLKRNHFSFYHT